MDGAAANILARMSLEAQALLPLVAVAATWLTVVWVRTERSWSRRNPGKWMYLASTGGLFALAVADPMAGLVGFVGSHTIEYFVVVNRSVVSEASHPGVLGKVSRLPHGPGLFLACYLAAAAGLFVVLYALTPGRGYSL